MSTGGPTVTAGGLRKNPRVANTLLGTRGDLPPRVRGALESLLEHTCNWFEPALRRTLDQLDNTLFGLAERAGSSAEQQRHFEYMREIKVARADVVPRFLQHIESRLATIRTPAETEATAADGEVRLSTLGLVDTAAFEEDLALQEIASKAEVRNSVELHPLAQRLAVIAGSPVYPNETLPLGPANIADALRFAVGNIDLDTEHRVLLYRHFDRAAIATIGAFYEAANAKLVALRILPHLVPSTFRRATPARKDTNESPVPGTAAPEAASPPDDATPAPSPAPRMTQGGGAAPSPRGMPMPRAGTPHPATAGQRVAPPSGMPPASDPGEVPSEGPQLFGMLRSLLGRVSPQQPSARAPGPTEARFASQDDLQGVLAAMQRSPATSSRKAAWDAEHFRNTLLVKLRRTSTGQPLTLGGEDADTVELVGMLFDYIVRETAGGDSLRNLLARLHVPILRVALADKTFFAKRDHPARELLNTIAETGSRWMGESDADNGLVERIRMVVDHVTSGYEGDLAVFEKLVEDLTTYMRQLARRADVVERRSVDAAKGRDKLEVARQSARAAITHVLEGTDPAPRVRTLLEHAWTDALTLSALREGEDGAEFRRRVSVASHLARSGELVSGNNDAVDASLRRELEGGLRQVGLHADDVDEVLRHLYGESTGATPEEEAEKEKQVARVYETIKEKARLGAAEDTRTPQPATPPKPLTAAERAALDKLRHVAFGTWFEFVVNQQGETVRRKLAWFSPVTGNCLFVNTRGVRADDRTLEQIARDIVRGQIRYAPAEQISLIDRAWRAIVDTLKRRSPPSAPAPVPA